MNINDKSVLEMLNKLIAIDRLNKTQILQMVNLVSLSSDINDLKENLKWESYKSFTKNWDNFDHIVSKINQWNLKLSKLVLQKINLCFTDQLFRSIFVKRSYQLGFGLNYCI